jgi:hypothetical protein
VAATTGAAAIPSEKGNCNEYSRDPSTQGQDKKRQRFFGIQFAIEGDAYAISRLPAHPDVARAAYRFRKLGGDQAVYDVRLTEHGLECECMGFLRHQHCKHAATTRAAAGIFELAAPAARAANVA